MRLLAGIALLCLAAAPVLAQDVPIYTDGLLNGFQDFSYNGGSAFNNPMPFHNGTPSIAFTGNSSFNAVSFAHPSGTFASGTYTSLRFFVNGGASGGQQIALLLQTNSSVNSTPVLAAAVPLDNYIAGGAVPANSWAQVDVPFSALAFNNDGSFDRIDIQTATGAQPVLYIDDVLLSTSTAGTQNSIFADGFDAELLFAPQYGGDSIKIYQCVLHPASGAADFNLLHTAPLGTVAGNVVMPNAVAFAPDGNLWVVDSGNAKRLLRYTQQTILTGATPTPDVIIGPVGGGAGDIFEMAFFGGFAYVSQSDFGATNRILKYSLANLGASGNPAPTLLTNVNLATPAGLAFDAQGRLWISNYNGGNGNNTVVRMNTSSGAVDKIFTNAAVGARNTLNNTEGLAFDQYGSLWVGNNGEPTITAFADWQLNDGMASEAADPVSQIDAAPGTFAVAPGHTGFVGGLAFDRSGNLWANYENGNSVLEYTLTSFPRASLPGVGSYATAAQPILANATTDPGFGGVAFWPVPNSLHR